LAQINQTLNLVRQDYQVLDQQLQQASASLSRNQLQQSVLLQQLAANRLQQLQDVEQNRTADPVDVRAQQIMTQREQALVDLQKKRDEGMAALQQCDAQRDAVHLDVDAAAQELADLEAQVQRLLENDDGYQTQLDTTYLSREIAAQAAEKTQVAEQDRQAKGAPYESNALFNYLWKRQYGTSQYRAGGLFAWLDDWVAKLVGYDKARANYWLLLQIPKRLAEHARLVGQRAEAELAKLQELETKVAKAAGVPEAQQILADAEVRQDQVDADIKAVEVALNEVHEAIAAFAMGEDDFTEQAINVLTQAYSARDLQHLEQMVRASLTTQDDELVRELADLITAQQDLREDLQQGKQAHRQRANRVKELEDVRRLFKRHRYDDLRSSFQNESLLTMVLGEFVRGAVNGSGVWDALRRQQRYQNVGGAWPDFGSGGLPQGRRGNSPWHWPGGRGGFRMPRRGGSASRGGSARRGGFRTGGGF